MRLLGILTCLSLLIPACGAEPETDVASVGSLYAPAPPPPVYTDAAAIDPLFAQRNDTTYLINFWATWCKPCLDELPMLEEVQDKYADRPLRVLLVSLDTDPAAIEKIPAYLERQDIDLPTLVLTDEGEDWKRALDEHWSGQLPTSVIYRNELRYVYRRNFMTLPDVEEAVKPLISQ